MKYLTIALAVIVVVLIMPLTMRGCSLSVPTPPNQASQTAHCIGLIVARSCNQVINQGTPHIDWEGTLNSLTVLIVAAAGASLMFYIGLRIAFRRPSQE